MCLLSEYLDLNRSELGLYICSYTAFIKFIDTLTILIMSSKATKKIHILFLSQKNCKCHFVEKHFPFISAIFV